MGSWMNRFFLMISLIVAVLLGLPHMPWRQLHESKGGDNIDWMADQYLDYSSNIQPLPPIQRFPTRNGDQLAIRIYKASINNDKPRINVVLHHGGAVDSTSLHPLAVGLQKRGLHVYVPDIRGHGESVTQSGLGNLDYPWQNLDDLEDLLEHFHLSAASTVFAGHSAQGVAAWYLASLDKWRERFAAFVSIAGGLSMEPQDINVGCFSNYVEFHLPRLNALMILNTLGITAFNKQSVLRGFRQSTNDIDEYTWEYSYNMALSHAPGIFVNYKVLLSKIPSNTHILAVWAGSDEAFMDQTHVLKPLCKSSLHVTIPGESHMGILFNETLAVTVADFVKTRLLLTTDVE